MEMFLDIAAHKIFEEKNNDEIKVKALFLS